jgi:hypothetical protein
VHNAAIEQLEWGGDRDWMVDTREVVRRGHRPMNREDATMKEDGDVRGG